MHVPLGDTYYFKFSTRAFASGAPTTLAGTPVISVYEENNLTQITAGITLTVDYDTVTGLHQVAVVATSGNGYEVGKYYDAVITTGTVGGVSVVGETVKHFRCMAAEGVAGVPDVNTTHVSDTAQTGNDNGADINTLITQVGTAGAGLTNLGGSGNNWNVGKTGYTLTATTGLGNQTANITGNLSGSVGSVTGAVGSVTGAVGSVTAGVALAAAQGAVTFTATGNDNAITLAGAGTGHGLSSTGGATGDGARLTGGATNGDGAHITGGTNGRGMHLVGVGDSAGLSANGGATSSGIHVHGGSTGATPGMEIHAHSTSGDALHFEMDGTGDAAPVLVDQIFDEAMAGHLTAGTAGLYLAISGGVLLDTSVTGTPTTTSVDITGGSTVTDNYEDQLCWIISGTGIGQVRPILSSSESAGTTTLTFDEAFKTAPVSGDRIILQSSHTHTLTQTQAGLATTTELDKVPKSDGTVAHNATALAAITADVVGDAVIGELTTQGDTNETALTDVQSRLPAALVTGRMSSDTVAISGSTTAADNLEASALGIVPGACEGTPSTTVVQTDLAEATDDHYIGRIIVFTSGNAAGEASDITDYTGVTGTVTITAITTAPAATDTFVIV